MIYGFHLQGGGRTDKEVIQIVSLERVECRGLVSVGTTFKAGGTAALPDTVGAECELLLTIENTTSSSFCR